MPDRSEPTPVPAIRRPTRIVLGVPADWTMEELGTGAMAWAAQQSLRWQCPVLLVHAWMEYQQSASGRSEDAWFDPTIWERTTRRPGAQAAAALARMGISASVDTRRDSASDALLAVLLPTDIVVLGTLRGRPIRHGFGGNVVHQLLRHAPCPVAAVPRAWRAQPRAHPRIMVGYNRSDQAEVALAWAIGECAASHGELILTRALIPAQLSPTDDADEAELLRQVRCLAERYGVLEVSLTDVSNSGRGTALALDDTASQADLLVLGNHQASWLAEITRASVTERAVTGAGQPVVVMPAIQAVAAADTSTSPGKATTAVLLVE